MGDGVFNIAKGKVAEYAARVIANDPTDSVIHVELGLGAISDATIIDLDTYQLVKDDAGFTEAAFTNYIQKLETSPVVTVTDASDKAEVDIPDITWTAAGNGGNETLTRLLVMYDSDSTAGTDANIVPMTFHDFAVLTDGSDLTAQFNASGFFRAA